MKWYKKDGEAKDVVISTRVRFARNLARYPFASKLGEKDAGDVIATVRAALVEADGYEFTDMSTLGALEARSMCERHYISSEFAAKKSPHAFIEKSDGDLSIMICEEDHLRIQCIKSGLAIRQAFDEASALERKLDGELEFAYNERLGYLTHCPTNLGTAMRVSVMLFLPAFSMFGRIEGLKFQLQKLGLAVRGTYGEGSDASGYLYQISNRETLGISEEETIKKLSEITAQIIAEERKLRESFSDGDRDELLDRAARAKGILLYSRKLTSAELMSFYSQIRLGMSLESKEDREYTTLDSLPFEAMPAGIALLLSGESDTSDRARDRRRADEVRRALSEVK